MVLDDKIVAEYLLCIYHHCMFVEMLTAANTVNVNGSS